MSSAFESMTGKSDYNFPEFDAPSVDPVALGQKWLKEAMDKKLNEPRSMVFVTANRSRMMSSRVMAILEFANNGIIFNTHSCSQKIKDTEEVPFACGHFYWRELGRQLSVSGIVKPLERERALDVWNKRPIPLHSMSAASRQSEPLESYEKLLETAKELEKYGALPCPDRFGIYVLEPQIIEFWASSSSRLHRRLRFVRVGPEWEKTKLQP